MQWGMPCIIGQADGASSDWRTNGQLIEPGIFGGGNRAALLCTGPWVVQYHYDIMPILYLSKEDNVTSHQRTPIHLTLENLPEERLLADFEKKYRKESDRLDWIKPIGYLSLFLGVAFLWAGGGSFVLIITGLMFLAMGGLSKRVDTITFFEANYEMVLDHAPPPGHDLFFRYIGNDRMSFYLKERPAEP